MTATATTATTKNEIQLKRRGVSKAATGAAPNGDHIEIVYHEGWSRFCFMLSGEHSIKRHRKLKAKTLKSAVKETGRILKLTFAPEIQAHCFAKKSTLLIWPYIGTDVYLTSAFYNEKRDVVLHATTEMRLITFYENHALPSWESVIQGKYSSKIAGSIGCYNSNVKAHGQGKERKEWVAWLIGQYIAAMPGETPVKMKSITK